MAHEENDYVRVPRKMYESLEARSKRLNVIEEVIDEAGRVLRSYEIAGVVTRPPSGFQAAAVHDAVVKLAKIAVDGYLTGPTK